MRVAFLAFALAIGPSLCAQEMPKRDLMDLRLLLPPEIPAVPGRECNVYFDNLVLCAPYLRNFLIVDVDCPKGTHQEERFTWTPTAEDVGEYPLTIRYYDPEDDLLAEGATTIRVYPPDAGAGQTLTMLMLGDSLTNASVYPAELLTLCQGEGNPRLTLIGTHQPITDRPEVRHEGYGGWRAANFVSMWGPETWNAARQRTRSPFLYERDGKPVLDFQQYCNENNGGRGPDYVTMLLGCNDNFGAKDDTIEASIDDFERNMEILIAEIHRVRPDTKIGVISLMPPAASQDAFGANYGCVYSRWQWRKNQHRVLERSFEAFMGREAENVFFVPAYVNLDCVHNYGSSRAPANARTDVEISRLNNGVHPAASGYRQMADSIYCWLKATLAR
ncbi:MAG: hypothetical protein HPY69_14755 [Armatimonadetes bacterium]|nr:hypothetical protein [Armatimonadota bacterium]